MATTLSDLHSHIIDTQILPRLDGPSLSSTAATSSYLRDICAHENHWSHICKSTWPSTTDPRLDHIISTFPAGHRSFFQDCFPALAIDVNHQNRRISSSSPQPDCSSCHPCPSQLISAVDIHYKNNIIYSRVEFTDTTADFLSSALRIKLNDDETSNRSGSKHGSGIFRSIDLKIDELAIADEAALSSLKESLTLSWILIDPTRKRAGNLSSIKPITARQDWMTNETHLLYGTVLPGCDPNKMVHYRIQVVLAVSVGGVGLQVKEVKLELLDLDFCRLKGRDFVVITQGALISEENNIRRKMVDDEESRRSYRDFTTSSIGSLANLQNDMAVSCHRVLQRPFYFLKLGCRPSIIGQKTWEFHFFILIVFVLLWLIGLI